MCGIEFICGAPSGETSCWCAQLPMVMPIEFDQDCRCTACLERLVGRKIEAATLHYHHDEILKIAHQYKEQKTLIKNIDYTIENGNYVFSRWYHLKRGSCCGNGCRHCPYG